MMVNNDFVSKNAVVNVELRFYPLIPRVLLLHELLSVEVMTFDKMIGQILTVKC